MKSVLSGAWTAFRVGVVAILALAAVSLGLTLHLRELAEARRDVQRLARSTPPASEAQAVVAWRQLYASRLGARPREAEIRGHFDRELTDRGWFTLDSVMTNYILARAGQIDRRTVPPGVYVAARAIGPDHPPAVWVTQYLAHFGLFSRHSYVLVVPADGGPARAYSAGLEGDFIKATPQPWQLYARREAYRPGAYDFPRRGQAIHEMVAITRVEAEIAPVEGRIRQVEYALRQSDLGYLPIRRNSNTVVGCLLAASGASVERIANGAAEALVRARLPGIGFPLGDPGLCRPPTSRDDRSDPMA